MASRLEVKRFSSYNYAVMKEKTKGNLILLLTAVLWGSGFISQKMGNAIMPPMTFNAIRQIMAFFALIPFAKASLRRSQYLSREVNLASALAHRKRRLWLAGFACGGFMLLGSLSQQMGLLTVSAGKSGFISAVYIVLVPLFSVMLGNRVSRRSVICIVLAMVGFGIMSLQLGNGAGLLGGTTPGDWWTLLSAAGFAAQIVAIGVFIDKDNAILISELQMIISGVIGLVIAIIVESPSIYAIWAGVPVLLYQTMVPTAAGYTLQIVGQKHTDASTAALIMSLEAVFAAIFGALILKEMMTTREIVGCGVIFVATILGQIEPRHPKSPS